jgi:hypothetical protein
MLVGIVEALLPIIRLIIELFLEKRREHAKVDVADSTPPATRAAISERLRATVGSGSAEYRDAAGRGR